MSVQTRDRRGSSAVGLIGVALALGLVGAVATPGCSSAASGGSPHSLVSRSTDTDGDRVRVKVSHGWSSLELKLRGEVTLSDDDSEVTGISPEGYFVLTLREGLRVRKVRVQPGPGGGLEYSGNAADSEAEARAWVARHLPNLVEESGLWAEERARRLLKTEGVEGVLAAVARHDHDHAKGVYLGVLMDEADLSPADFERMQRLVGEGVESDYHAAAILGRMLEHRVGRGVAGETLFEAIDGIESAYHRAQILKPLAGRAPEREMSAYLRAVDGIGSDYHRQDVIGHLLDQRELGGAALSEVLSVVRSIDSDHHSAELLRRMSSRIPEHPEARRAWFEAAAGLGSDYHKAEVLSAAAREARGDDAVLLDVIQASAGIASAHHMAQVLESILEQGDLSQPVLRGLLDTVKQNLNSSYHRGVLLDRITDRLTI